MVIILALTTHVLTSPFIVLSLPPVICEEQEEQTDSSLGSVRICNFLVKQAGLCSLVYYA